MPHHNRGSALALADKVERDELRVDEVIDGLIDPNAPDDVPVEVSEAEMEEEIEAETVEEEDDGGAAASATLLKLKADALERFVDHPHALQQNVEGARQARIER